jgi:hypothetical protein
MISEKTRWILKTRFILEHQSQTWGTHSF